jgi:RNA polymerase sigma factor (sigma-70 family)
MVQCPFDSSVKGLLLEILRTVDGKLGSDYCPKALNSRTTVDALLGCVASVCVNHVGLLIIDEIQEFTVIPDSEVSPIEQMMLRDAINSFLESLPAEARIIFVRRYWYCSPISDIAKDYSLPEGTVRSTLSRTRKRFREYLTKEGVAL